MLGRAASLIGEETHIGDEKKERRVRKGALSQNLTITLNGGSLGSWVDEERS